MPRTWLDEWSHLCDVIVNTGRVSHIEDTWDQKCDFELFRPWNIYTDIAGYAVLRKVWTSGLLGHQIVLCLTSIVKAGSSSHFRAHKQRSCYKIVVFRKLYFSNFCIGFIITLPFLTQYTITSCYLMTAWNTLGSEWMSKAYPSCLFACRWRASQLIKTIPASDLPQVRAKVAAMEMLKGQRADLGLQRAWEGNYLASVSPEE